MRLIIPFPPGGSNDVVGRLVANQLSEKLGHKVFVDNRGGAGGVLGTEAAATAAPDGYTLLVISIAHAVNPALYKLNYDPIKSFAPISIMATGPNVLVVNPQLPVKNVKELLALAKEKPGTLDYASAGVGSFQHLGGELFKLVAGVNLQHVPYKGGGPAMQDVIAGHVKVMFSSLVQTTPFIQSGQLRALGTGGEKRNPVLPDVPTIAEAGVPGYVADNWWGIVAPAGTPQPIVDRLYKDMQVVLKSPELTAAFAREGAAAVTMSTAEFSHYIESRDRQVGEGGQRREYQSAVIPRRRTRAHGREDLSRHPHRRRVAQDPDPRAIPHHARARHRAAGKLRAEFREALRHLHLRGLRPEAVRIEEEIRKRHRLAELQRSRSRARSRRRATAATAWCAPRCIAAAAAAISAMSFRTARRRRISAIASTAWR